MRFDRFAERMSEVIARPWTFWLTAAVIVAWLPTLVLASPGLSDLIVDAVTNPISLLLLILLHNSSYRSERANDDRHDELANGLAMVLRGMAAREPEGARQAEMLGMADWLIEEARQASALETGEEP